MNQLMEEKPVQYIGRKYKENQLQIYVLPKERKLEKKQESSLISDVSYLQIEKITSKKLRILVKYVKNKRIPEKKNGNH